MPILDIPTLKMYVDRLICRTEIDQFIRVKLILPKGINIDPQAQKFLEKYEVCYLAPGSNYLSSALDVCDEAVLIINKVALPENRSWLYELSGIAQIKRISAASPIIIDDTKCISDCGLVYDNGLLSTLFKGTPYVDNMTYFGNTEWCRNTDALTGSITLLSNKEFRSFLKTRERYLNLDEIIRTYTLSKTEKGKDVCIWSNVQFNDLTITKNTDKKKSRYGLNESLEIYGGVFHIKARDNTIATRLLRIPIRDYANEK